MNTFAQKLAALVTAGILLAGCGGGGEEASPQGQAAPSGQQSGELTPFEQEHGIGPVAEVVKLDEINEAMARQGQDLFKTKCSACHKVDQRYVGPSLGDVLDRRSPTFVMNMIMNPDGMVKNHPVAKELLQEYLSPMPNQNLSREEARAIVEYLATQNADSAN